MTTHWQIPHGVETNGVGSNTTAHLNLTGRTMADVWGLKPEQVAATYQVVPKTPRGPGVFALVSDDGSYLHESGVGLTADQKHRWKGSARQLDKARTFLAAAKGLHAERVA